MLQKQTMEEDSAMISKHVAPGGCIHYYNSFCFNANTASAPILYQTTIHVRTYAEWVFNGVCSARRLVEETIDTFH